MLSIMTRPPSLRWLPIATWSIWLVSSTKSFHLHHSCGAASATETMRTAIFDVWEQANLATALFYMERRYYEILYNNLPQSERPPESSLKADFRPDNTFESLFHELDIPTPDIYRITDMPAPGVDDEETYFEFFSNGECVL